ncbi:MAG: TrmH family RNA methyltransferase [Christensenellales bacterium]
MVVEVAEYNYVDLDKLLNEINNQEHATVVLLDGLEDPHNLGAIMRTADATGIDGIIIPKNRSVSLNQTVAKVSTGAIEYVKVSTSNQFGSNY